MVDVCLRLVFSIRNKRKFLSYKESFPFARGKGFIRNLTLRRIRGNEIVLCL